MSFPELYEFVKSADSTPLILKGFIDKKVKEIAEQDQIEYTPLSLNPDVSLGHIKQYTLSDQEIPYSQTGTKITDIRYHNKLNMCWQRFVCCKELMHVFDAENERAKSKMTFNTLLTEISSLPLFKHASDIFKSEIRAKWMALAILCPLQLRSHYKEKIDKGEMSNYDVALALRIPELVIPAIMYDSFSDVVEILTNNV